MAAAVELVTQPQSGVCPAMSSEQRATPGPFENMAALGPGQPQAGPTEAPVEGENEGKERKGQKDLDG